MPVLGRQRELRPRGERDVRSLSEEVSREGEPKKYTAHLLAGSRRQFILPPIKGLLFLIKRNYTVAAFKRLRTSAD